MTYFYFCAQGAYVYFMSIYQLFIKESSVVLSDSTVGMAIVLQILDPDLIPATQYGPLCPSRIDL